MKTRKKLILTACAVAAVLALALPALGPDPGSMLTRDDPTAGKGERDPHFSAAASSVVIAAEPNHLYYEKTIVEYHPSGAIFVLFDDLNLGNNRRSVLLYKYDGGRVSFVKDVAETNQTAYEPDMVIDDDGWIHVVWAEGATNVANTQHVKYRYFNGSSWSGIATLKTMTITGTPSALDKDKVDDVRLAVDGERNLFVVLTKWPTARCESFSRFGTRIYDDPIPASGRSKHAGVAVDPNYVHVTWVGIVDGQYYIQYARRNNAPGAAWNVHQLVQNSVNGVVDRPFIRVNSQRVPQLAYLKTTADNKGRHVYHRSWQGSGFSSAYQISAMPAAYHPPEMATLDNSNMMISIQTWGATRNYFNWKQNGNWSGFVTLNSVPYKQSYGDCDLNPSGGEAAIAYAAGSTTMLVIFDNSGNPNPPEPEPIPNVPPTAAFTFSPTSGLYPLTVGFNAGSSKDSDGTIVKYAWNFGDGASGSGKTVQHVYAREGIFTMTLKVTDDDGASATATGQLEVFGVAPPLNLQFQRHENRNLFSVEYLYRVTWNHNPRNDQIGSKIVHYKIFRREVGMGGFTHFNTVQAGNLTSFEYLDRTLGSTARTYEYAISGVDTMGRESPWAQ